MDYSNWLCVAKEVIKMAKELSFGRLALLVGAVIVLAALWRAPAIMEAAAKLWPPTQTTKSQ